MKQGQIEREGARILAELKEATAATNTVREKFLAGGMPVKDLDALSNILGKNLKGLSLQQLEVNRLDKYHKAGLTT